MLAASASFATMNALIAALARAGLWWELTAFARAFVGLLFALAIARSRGASLKIENKRTMWTRSVAGSTSMLLTFFSLTHMPLADATALINTTPLWIALLAWVLLREVPGRAVVAAICLALTGVVLVQRPSFARGEFAGFAAIAAGITSALSMVSLRRLGKETPEAVVVHFSAVATGVTFVAGVVSVFRRGFPHGMALAIWLIVPVVGLTATIGQLAMTRAYSLDRAARVGAAGWAQIVLALVIDGAFRRVWPAGQAWAGIALLMLSGWVLLLSARLEANATAARERAAEKT